MLVQKFCNAFAAINRSLAPRLLEARSVHCSHGSDCLVADCSVRPFVNHCSNRGRGGGVFGRYTFPGALGLPFIFAVSKLDHVRPVEEKGRLILGFQHGV